MKTQHFYLTLNTSNLLDRCSIREFPPENSQEIIKADLIDDHLAKSVALLLKHTKIKESLNTAPKWTLATCRTAQQWTETIVVFV